MSDRINISQMVDACIERLWIRAGNEISLQPGGVITRHALAGEDDSRTIPLPRSGTPDLRAGRFVFNFVPIRGVAVDPYESVSLQNSKAYVKVMVTPVAYSDGGGPPIFGIGYADVDSLTLTLTPHGTTPTRVNATVDSTTGAVTQGTYYFYCGKLFSDGRVQGLSSAEGTDDVDYFYTNITSFGWLPPPSAANHYPPIDLI